MQPKDYYIEHKKEINHKHYFIKKLNIVVIQQIWYHVPFRKLSEIHIISTRIFKNTFKLHIVDDFANWANEIF